MHTDQIVRRLQMNRYDSTARWAVWSMFLPRELVPATYYGCYRLITEPSRRPKLNSRSEITKRLADCRFPKHSNLWKVSLTPYSRSRARCIGLLVKPTRCCISTALNLRATTSRLPPPLTH